MKKQSQFVPGRIAVTPFIKGAYGNNLSIGDDENKAKQTRSIVICYIFEVIRKEIQERRTARINGKKQSQFYTGHTYVNPLTATVYRKLSVRADQKKKPICYRSGICTDHPHSEGMKLTIRASLKNKANFTLKTTQRSIKKRKNVYYAD